MEQFPTGWTLIPLGSLHLAQILHLDQVGLGGFWSQAGYEEEMARTGKEIWGFMTADQQLLGFGILWVIVDEAHLVSVVTDPRHRRQGIGEAIVRHLLTVAIQRQCQWAVLEVREDNQAARQLYEKVGFTLVGRRKNYYHHPEEDALVLWKKPLVATT